MLAVTATVIVVGSSPAAGSANPTGAALPPAPQSSLSPPDRSRPPVVRSSPLSHSENRAFSKSGRSHASQPSAVAGCARPCSHSAPCRAKGSIQGRVRFAFLQGHPAVGCGSCSRGRCFPIPVRLQEAGRHLGSYAGLPPSGNRDCPVIHASYGRECSRLALACHQGKN